MSLKTLSEAIILQSAEDVLSTAHREDGIEFFSGEGFRLCAEIAGMTIDEKLKLLNILLGSVSKGKSAGDCAVNIVSSKKKTLGRRAPVHRTGRMTAMNAA